jgi:hypothetical protein
MQRCGALPSAASFEVAADELEAALRDEREQPLTLGQAAAESGYSEDHLGRELRLGRVPNAGKRHAPRIRRADLPTSRGIFQPFRSANMIQLPVPGLSWLTVSNRTEADNDERLAPCEREVGTLAR